jgi:hypothetical protein
MGMENKARRQQVLLGALVVLLVAALWWNVGGGGGDQALPAISARAGAAPQRPGARATGAAPALVETVALAELQAPAPEPVTAGRNPFRFQAAAAPPPPPDEDARPDGRGVPPAGGPFVQGPAGPPPIPLRFIGTVDEVSRHLKLAVLSDGRNVFYGREGDIIEGRYRIVRIGVESIEMTHVDGRGQQTIRLSGS